MSSTLHPGTSEVCICTFRFHIFGILFTRNVYFEKHVNVYQRANYYGVRLRTLRVIIFGRMGQPMLRENMYISVCNV